MKPVRTLIVDDEELARERLRRLLAVEPGFEVVGECADGPAALAELARAAPELVLLDVQMPGMDGFELLERAQRPLPAVVFVTAHDRHALRAFEVHALDYLLKPCGRERLHEALARARAAVERARLGELDERVLALVAELRERRRFPERLIVRGSGRVSFVAVAEIDRIEACGNYARLVCGTESHLLRRTLNALEAELDPATFVRIHRSSIVRGARVKRLEPLAHGDAVAVLADGTRLPVSRTYRPAAEACLRGTR